MRASESPGAIDKALVVLECLSGHWGPMRLAEIVRNTGLPKSTVHRMLAILEGHQAVRRVVGGYVVGDLISRLAAGGRDAELSRPRRVLTPFAAELYEATHLVTTVAVLRGMTAVSLITLYPAAMAGLVLRGAEQVPAHCTAVGKALLAATGLSPGLPPGEDWLVPYGPNTITARAGFDDELARIRREGVARSREEYLAGTAGVAIAVPGGRLPIAIGVGGPTGRFDELEVEWLLRRTAHEAAVTLRRYDFGAPALGDRGMESG